jgi:hypothetical protein
MVTRDTYDWLMLAAQAFSAIGTVGAVIVAIGLARRQNRPSVQATVNLVHLVATGQRAGDGPEFLKISAVNDGFRDVVITNIGWQLGHLRKRHFIQLPAANPFTAQVPKKLGPGERADFLFPKDEFRSNNTTLRDEIEQSRLIRGHTKRLRAVVFLSTGEHFFATPDAHVLALFQPQAPPG